MLKPFAILWPKSGWTLVVNAIILSLISVRQVFIWLTMLSTRCCFENSEKTLVQKALGCSKSISPVFSILCFATVPSTLNGLIEYFSFNWAIQSVWLIVRQASLVAIHNWSAVSLIILDTIYRAIDWNLIKVSTKSVPVSIWVWKNSSLEYSVICKLNSWH